MNDRAPFWIHPDDSSLVFPDAGLALREPDGLLAIGGDLEPQRLLTAYQQGIFPWYSHDQPILWWSPDPRTVLFPEQLKISRSLRKTLRQRPFSVSFDRDFDAVIGICAAPRAGSSGTWITTEMTAAYKALHRLGFAHSVECWRDQKLVGGLYGVALGKVFFGESMFSIESNASKVAFAYLAHQLKRWDFALIDCQVYSAHLASLGAQNVSRDRFVEILHTQCHRNSNIGRWSFDPETCNHDW